MRDTLAAASREGRVMAAVQELVAELDRGGPPRAVTPRASLDRDLGIGSLERVELLLRIETALGVRLADHVVANAGTVEDLLQALDARSDEPAPRERPPAAAEHGDGCPAPDDARTLVDVLRWHADRTPHRVHLVLREDTGEEQRLCYAALWNEASRVSSALRERGVVRGECVALMLRTERAFFTTYVGTLLAGAVPVPLYPPFRPDQIGDYAARQAAILRNAEARVLVTFDQAERVAALLRPLAPSLGHVVTGPDLVASHDATATAAIVASVPDEALALIQYTSGSTGHPKGVALSHANLLANIRAFGRALGVRPDDVAVSWLPLYHDMGLIGMWLGALYHGVPLVVLSPLAFLSRPSRWLEAFHVHRGTMSAAPNFAYDICARKVPDADLEGLDLSSWRAALNGAEAVSAETIARFTARFAPRGFRPEAMCPVYGLAETSLCLTVPPVGTPPRVDRIAREPFQRAREIRPATGDEPAVAFVGCGRPVPTTDIRIVDARGREAGERVEGRIQFRGPSATRGYYRNPEATAELIEDGWLNTGDLGYVADSDIFVTGRRKDIIIAGGRNLDPHEIEHAVAELPGVRRGCVAAFGSYDEARGTERLVVVAESKARDRTERTRLQGEAARCLTDLLGMPPDKVLVVSAGVIPKTPSGKIRRQATRERFERGNLERRRASIVAQWAWLVAGAAFWRLRRATGRLGAALFTLYLWLLVGSGLVILRLLLEAGGRGGRGGAITRAWCRLVFRLGTFRVRYGGTEQLDGLGAAVFVANHSSFMDALLLRAALPGEVRMAAKDTLLGYPFVGGLLARQDVIPIARGRESAADALTALVRDGGSFAIFPEGTFVRAPGLLPFRLGAFRAAVETGRPVVPVAITGTRASWPDQTLLVRRRPLGVTIAAPLRPTGTDWREIVRLRDEARNELARATGEPAFRHHTDDSAARAGGQA